MLPAFSLDSFSQELLHMGQATFVRQDDPMNYTPAGAVAVGAVVIEDGLCAVANAAIAAAVEGTLVKEDVWDIVKDTSVFTDNDPVYWNPVGDPVGGTAGTGAATLTPGGFNLLGYVPPDSSALTGDTTVRVALTKARQRGVAVKKQVAPTAKTVAVTLTAAELYTGIINATPTATGATAAYTLPTGTLLDAAGSLLVDEAFDWVLINNALAAADTITVTAGDGHTIVGGPIVQSLHVSTGGITGYSAQFRTRKTAANTFVTYRIA